MWGIRACKGDMLSSTRSENLNKVIADTDKIGVAKKKKIGIESGSYIEIQNNPLNEKVNPKDSLKNCE